MTNKQINLYDNVKLKDSHTKNEANVHGWVEIYDGDKLIHSDHNTIVYTGRSYLQKQIFDPSFNFKIRGISIGNGGQAANLNPVEVNLNTTNLINPLQWKESQANNLYIADVNGQFTIKKISYDDDVQLNNDPNNENQPLIQKIIINIDTDELNNGLQLNEQGLWLMNDTYDPNTKVLFAKTNFAGINKTDGVALSLVWYVFF